MPRILFVAMANSIHTARWIQQIAEQGWDIHLFPSEDSGIDPALRNLVVHDFIIRLPGLERSVRLPRTWPWLIPRGAGLADRLLRRLRRSKRLPPLVSDRGQRLARLIRRLEPDIVHSLETQHAGYLTLEAKNHLGDSFPTWIVTNWGSDIYLFGRLEEHKPKIRAILQHCDYYACECQRDVVLAREFGFEGQVLPVVPNTGGMDLDVARGLWAPGPVSGRRLILVKGYQGWAGRAFVALRAIALASEALGEYHVAVYSAGRDVRIAGELVSQSTGIPIEFIPQCSHEDMLRLLGQARLYIGLSISDAASTSLLEALAMGAFPVQSCTSCANEWIRDGTSGFIVPPEDPAVVAAAIRRAVSDDALVNRAAARNARVAEERLDRAVIRQKVVAMYEQIATDSAADRHRGTSR